MKRNKKTIESPLPKAGIENKNVSINFCNPLNLLNILSIFVTLITLNILAIWGRTDNAADDEPEIPTWERTISKIEAMTTKKSKMFQPE